MKYTALSFFALLVLAAACNTNNSTGGEKTNDSASAKQKQQPGQPEPKPDPALDTARYSQLMTYMINGDTSGLWPVKHDYPRIGAVLPFKRVVSYYGNLYSKQMGILGELPKDSMLRKLRQEVDKWTKADSVIPAVPALHYIAVTAQTAPGAGGKYRLRMPFSQIDTVLSWAKEIDALVFIDIQVGLSTVQQELPEFEKYLSMPNVHFGIDPEFSMKTGARPGAVVGTFDAADINYVTDYLAGLVKKHNLPPKMLVVHRFTQGMVTNYKNITLKPEVQIIMDMDGWGEAERKVNTYKMFIHPEPVQFTGFKIFYKNDTKKVNRPREMQPEDLLKLRPVPVYIQYQ
jgi:hypothetical protein